MDPEIDVLNPEKGLHDLVNFTFATNCTLEEEDESTMYEETKAHIQFDPPETLDGFTELLFGLLKFKRENQASDKAELAQRSEQFETLLQKLEAEVRCHIRAEQQLKIHIENHKIRIDELENAEKTDKSLIKELEEKCSGKRNTKHPEIEKLKKEMDEKVRSLLEVVDKKEKVIHKIECENLKLKTLLEEKARECDSIKKELVRSCRMSTSRDPQYAVSIDYSKKKIDTNKSNQRGMDKSPASMMFKRMKSMGDAEVPKIVASPMRKSDIGVSGKKGEHRSSGAAATRGHMRCGSDSKIPGVKRAPSR